MTPQERAVIRAQARVDRAEARMQKALDEMNAADEALCAARHALNLTQPLTEAHLAVLRAAVSPANPFGITLGWSARKEAINDLVRLNLLHWDGSGFALPTSAGLKRALELGLTI